MAAQDVFGGAGAEEKQAALVGEENVVMELEHMIGFSTVKGGLAHDAVNPNKFIHACGASLAIGHFHDPHNQTFLLGHDQYIECFTTSRSAKLMATGQGGKNSDICLWEYLEESETYKLRHRFYMHDEDTKILALAFSDDERILYSVGEDSTLFVWDINTGNYITFDKSPVYSKATCLSSGGFWTDVKGLNTDFYQCAMGTNDSDSKCALWMLKVDPFAGKIEKLPLPATMNRREYSAIAWSPDGRFMFAGTTSGEFCCCIKQAKKQEFKIGTYTTVCRLGVQSIRCVPSGDSYLIVTGGGDGSVMVWRPYIQGKALNFESVSQFSVTGGVLALSVAVWSGETGPTCEALAGTDSGFVYRINLTGPIFQDRSQQVLPPLRISESHIGAVQNVAFGSKINELFATCGRDRTVRVWDSSDYTVRMEASVSKADVFPTCVAMTLDSEIVLSGWNDGKIRAYLVNPEDRKEHGSNKAWEISDVAAGRGISNIVLSNNERFFVTGGYDGMVRVWGYSGHELVTQLKQHMNEITGFALFDDDIHLLSASRDKSFYCWDVRREKAISWHTQRQGAVLDIALSHDQTQVLTVGADGGVTFWDLRQPNPTKVIDKAHASEVTSIAVSSDGKCFATGGADHTVKLWDWESCNVLSTGSGHSGCVNAVRFSPDCRQLVSVADDGMSSVWNIYV